MDHKELHDKSALELEPETHECCDNSENIHLSLPRRWTIYIIGLIETFIFGGCVFGWAQLVFVLKNERIFFNLCLDPETNTTSRGEEIQGDTLLEGCEEQDEKFALIYTITILAYGIPSILIGFFLHHFGLALSRITASLMLIGGFLALGSASEENGSWLYLAMVLLAVGGNQLRMAGFQFCNLFPKYRSTALTVISGSYGASAGLFMIFQVCAPLAISFRTVNVTLAALAFLSLPATLLMPRHHIPHEINVKIKEKVSKTSAPIPLFTSLFSISSFTQIYWKVVTFTGVVFFATFFNSWVSRISATNEEAGYYSMLYSMSAFATPVVSPLPGLLTDFLARRNSTESSPDKRLLHQIRSPIIPMIIVVVLSLLLQLCLFFNHEVAIYCALLILMLVRPSIMSVANSFLRIRFPADHFNRMIGTHGTITSVLNGLQYPLFLWSQTNFTAAMSFFFCLIVLSFFHPLHLLSSSYLRKVCDLLQQNPIKGQEKQLIEDENRKSSFGSVGVL